MKSGNRLLLYRSFLFVPGSSERFIEKAMGLDVDVVVLDLEDSVARKEKLNARKIVANHVPKFKRIEKVAMVRVNDASSRFMEDDVRQVMKNRPDGIVIPKCESVNDIHKLAALLKNAKEIPIIPILESPTAIMNARNIAGSDPRISGLTIGIHDLARTMGIPPSIEPQAVVSRSLVALAAKEHGLACIDSAHGDLENLDALTEEARESKRLGYTGKFAIHPSQLSVINEVFAPSEKDVTWAKEIVSEFELAEEKGVGAIKHRGKLVDIVQYRMAKDILNLVKFIEKKEKK